MRRYEGWHSLKTPETIEVKLKDRSLCNLLSFCLYRLMRAIFVSFWFYFSPYILQTLQFFLPLYVLQRDGALTLEPPAEEECTAVLLK